MPDINKVIKECKGLLCCPKRCRAERQTVAKSILCKDGGNGDADVMCAEKRKAHGLWMVEDAWLVNQP